MFEYRLLYILFFLCIKTPNSLKYILYLCPTFDQDQLCQEGFDYLLWDHPKDELQTDTETKLSNPFFLIPLFEKSLLYKVLCKQYKETWHGVWDGPKIMEMNPQEKKKKEEKKKKKVLTRIWRQHLRLKTMIVTEKKLYFWTFYMYITVSTGFPKVKIINSCCEYNISIEQKSSNFIKEKKGRR